jgi:hypothetical protein
MQVATVTFLAKMIFAASCTTQLKSVHANLYVSPCNAVISPTAWYVRTAWHVSEFDSWLRSHGDVVPPMINDQSFSHCIRRTELAMATNIHKMLRMQSFGAT